MPYVNFGRINHQSFAYIVRLPGGVKEEENDARVGRRSHFLHVCARGRVAGREAQEGGGSIDKLAEPRGSGEGREVNPVVLGKGGREGRMPSWGREGGEGGRGEKRAWMTSSMMVVPPTTTLTVLR